MSYIEKLLESVDLNSKRLDNLVRAGLINTTDYPTFKIAIKKVSLGKMNNLSPRETKVVSAALNSALSIIIDDDTVYNASLMKLRNEETINDIDGNQLTESETHELFEACDCIKKAREKMEKEKEQDGFQVSFYHAKIKINFLKYISDKSLIVCGRLIYSIRKR